MVRSKVTKAGVKRAMLALIHRKWSYNQKEVREYLGGGSEATIAKYITEIKLDSVNDQKPPAIYSPDIPQELAEIFERVYHVAQNVAEQSFEENNAAANMVEFNAREEVRVLTEKLTSAVDERREYEVRVIRSGHEVELKQAALQSELERNESLQEEISKKESIVQSLKEAGLTEIRNLRSKCEEDRRVASERSFLEMSKLSTGIKLLQSQLSDSKERLDLENDRFDKETAALYRQIDESRQQNKKDKADAKSAFDRTCQELDISHAREEKLAIKSGQLQKEVEDIRAESLDYHAAIRNAEELNEQLGQLKIVNAQLLDAVSKKP
jgi:hypothetical protein